MASGDLTEAQTNALLDILSHNNVYAEIRAFRDPGSLSYYGPPFDTHSKKPSTSPSLQSLVADFVVDLPGIKEVSEDFYRTQIASIIENLEEAELSDSYDKGTIGIRRTVATAIAAILEYPVRGIFNGFGEPKPHATVQEYDIHNPDDLGEAFQEMLRQAVYGTLIDDIVQKIGQTDQLSEHTNMVQAAHEFGLVNLASFLHYALILSPKGQHILTLIDQANKLVPYAILKQTLRIGNVASMINAMMKVVLAKVSVGTVTNWMGITSGASEGHNLMQQIISTVLNWDVREMKSKVSRIEKDKSGPKKEQLAAIKAYVSKSREQHAEIRKRSQAKSKPMATIILQGARISDELNEHQHKVAQDYLATQLSIRDREQIIQVLCDASPDHLTQSVRDLVAGYMPVIREVHNAVDLSDTLSDFERWLRDLLKLAKLSDQQGRGRSLFSRSAPIVPPTVGDFVALFHKHQYSLHKFLHQCVKNGAELTSWWHEYALQAVSHFRRKTADPTGNLSKPLRELFLSLPAETQAKLRPVLDSHHLYISKLHAASTARLCTVMKSAATASAMSSLQRNESREKRWSARNSRTGSPATASSGAATPSNRGDGRGGGITSNRVAENISAKFDIDPGPGAFLARWRHLLNTVELPPGLRGPTLPQTHTSDNIKDNSTNKTGPSGNSAGDTSFDRYEVELYEEEEAFVDARESVDELGLEEEEKVPRPDIKPVIDALESEFRDLLAKQSCTW